MPVTLKDHGIMKCCIKYPGELVARDVTDLRAHEDSVIYTHVHTPATGHYEVKWYGSRRKDGRFHEITRAAFDHPSLV